MRWLLPLMLSLACVAALGCAVPQPQNTPISQWFEYDPPSERGFYIYVPSTYSRERPAPLIVSCHGTPPFDVAEHHIREWKMLAEQNGCIVVAPQLVGTDGLLGAGPLSAMLEDERYILSLISSLGYRFNIDRANIMITGFSGGGFPTYWVGLRHPEIFSAIAARSANFSDGNLDGWYPGQAVNSRILVYYGSNDPGAIQGQSERGLNYLRTRGFTVEKVVIPGAGHERHPEVAMEFFKRNWQPPKPSAP